MLIFAVRTLSRQPHGVKYLADYLGFGWCISQQQTPVWSATANLDCAGASTIVDIVAGWYAPAAGPRVRRESLDAG
eukprot:COSAG02_NODE_3767_length_6268_cov_2.428757_9_plen_76_part_00